MSESIVCDRPNEDVKYLVDIKEEILDASSVTDIDSIKNDSPCAIVQDEVFVKEEPLECINESDLKSSDPLNINSSNLKVCCLKYSLNIMF